MVKKQKVSNAEAPQEMSLPEQVEKYLAGNHTPLMAGFMNSTFGTHIETEQERVYKLFNAYHASAEQQISELEAGLCTVTTERNETKDALAAAGKKLIDLSDELSTLTGKYDTLFAENGTLVERVNNGLLLEGEEAQQYKAVKSTITEATTTAKDAYNAAAGAVKEAYQKGKGVVETLFKKEKK
jgi:hypothetical protein